MADKSFNKLPKTNMPVTPKTSKFGKTPMPPATTKGLPRSGRVNMNRMSSDDKSRQNPSFRSSIAGYVKNVGKEAKDFGKAYKATGEMSNKSGPGTDSAANRLRKKQDQEMGQFFGALFQGRRYR
jgi:hypothetical protein